MKKNIFFIVVFIVLSGCFKEKRSNNAGEKMQEFVINISKYAKDIDADFIIIPQNGIELVFNDIEPEEGLNMSYIDAVDGLGIEELFYDGSISVDDYRLNMLRDVKSQLLILVADYVLDKNLISDAIQRNINEGFIPFPRENDNYDYQIIPNTVINENTNDIFKLANIQNYLYLISDESYSTKNDMITAISATNYDLVLIDLFFKNTMFSQAEINSLKTKDNGAKRLVISYISVGAAENYRYYWQEDWKLHHPNWLKKPYSGYEDEIWVKFWKKEWQKIIYGNDDSYIKKIVDAGFDGAYLDNVEVYYILYFDE